jgi:hypothetical protein
VNTIALWDPASAGLCLWDPASAGFSATLLAEKRLITKYEHTYTKG